MTRLSAPGLVRIRAQLGSGSYIMTGVVFLASVLPWFWYRYSSRRATIVVLFLAAAALIAAFDLNFSRLDVGRSVKPLALVLQRDLRPGDEVMTYQEYYQDLPVYLQRRITVIDWKGELEFGMSVEDARGWMIDDAAFRARWNAGHTVYLLASQLSYQRLREHPPGAMRLIAQTERVVLLTNREGAR